MPQALCLVVATDDPKAFLANRSANIQRLLRPVTVFENDAPLTEGAFVQVRDASGKIVATAGYSIRTGLSIGL